jgi:CP family cyanate transporter-like MFS transporter
VRRLPLLVAGLVLTGLNLRIAVATVPPLLSDLEQDPGMSSTVAGVLTSLPVLCYGLLAVAAPPLIRRLGGEATLVLVLLAVTAGVLVRAAGSTPALFLGTVVAGAGAAVGNVIVPAVVKGRFPLRVGVLMGVYTAVLSTGAALGGGLVVPLERSLGWQAALAIWAVPAVLALAVVVAAAVGSGTDRSDRGGVGEMRSLLHDRLAWQVTLFFGIQSAVFYIGLSWLPSILRSDGYDAGAAGALLAAYALGGVPTAVAAPVLATRVRDQRVLVLCAVALEAVAVAGLLLLPDAAPAWVAFFAVGQGAAFSLALTLIVLRSPDGRRGAELSGMTQAIGYCIAALGPFAVGVLHAAEGGWTGPLLLLVALCAGMAVAGAGAGRPRLVSPGAAAGVPLAP